MSYDTVVASIVARVDAQWTTTSIVHQNEEAQPARDTDGKPTSWVYFEVLDGTDEQASIGAPGDNLYRRTGLIFAHVFVPRGTGDGTARQYATQLGAIFRGQTFGQVTCEGASIGGGESADENGNYWRRSVSVPFWTDDTA